MQERKLALALLAALMFWLGLIGLAQADKGGDSAVTLVPVPGRGGGARLRTQTVDITVTEDAQGVWADTRVWLQLSNPYTRAISVTLALPGPQPLPGSLPATLRLAAGGADLALEPAPAPAKGLRVPLGIGPKAEVAVQMTYRQALSETRGLVTYAYPLSASGQWGQAPESSRLTLNFATPMATEQILGHVPEYRRSNGQTFSWSWDAQNAPDIWLAFFTPSWWNSFIALQAAAAAPGATAAQHLALSEVYQQLATMPALAFPAPADFYSRYYPAAVAELQAAIAVTPQGTPAQEAVTAHQQLARLYRGQAARLGRGAGDTYLELAATEAQTALSLGLDDPVLRTLASETFVQLAADAKERGEGARAEGYLSRLAALGTNAGADQQRAARLALAAEATTRGDLLTARQVISESFGANVVDIPALRPPLAGQVLVNVETLIDGPSGQMASAPNRSLAGRRRLVVTLVDYADPAVLTRLIDQAARAWRGMQGVTVKSGPDWLSLEFAFRDQANLAEIQDRLARLQANVPELALLSAALSPEALNLQVSEDRLQRAWHYAETADLQQATAAWQQRANEIRAARLRLAPLPTPAPTSTVTSGTSALPAPASATQSPGATSTPDPDLGRVQRALWGANADAWAGLSNRSYAQYSVRLGETGPTRQWHVAAGARRGLSVDKVDWVQQTLLLIAAGAAVILLLLAVLLWRVL
jgi:hypothetical protein